jgi:hypothetical protein
MHAPKRTFDKVESIRLEILFSSLLTRSNHEGLKQAGIEIAAALQSNAKNVSLNFETALKKFHQNI